MNQDEIIEMARQAGFYDGLFSNESFRHHLAAFAYFVAAKEREACVRRVSVALLGKARTTSTSVINAIWSEGKT